MTAEGEKLGGVFCHGGILSSAKAILRDLDSKDILSSMEHVEMHAGQDSSEILDEAMENVQNEKIKILGQDEDVHLPIQRAQSIIHEAAGKGWNLIDLHVERPKLEEIICILEVLATMTLSPDVVDSMVPENDRSVPKKELGKHLGTLL